MSKFRVVVEERLCKSCGICVALCPRDVFTTQQPLNKAKATSPEECTGCGICEGSCPDWAIDVEEEGDSA